MGQLRAFVAKLIMSRVRTFWVLFGLRLYSDSRCLAKNWPSKRVCRLLGPVKRSKFRFFGQSHSHQTFTMSHINQMDWTCIEKNTVSEIRLIGQTYQANLVSGPAKLLGAWQRRYCRFQDRAPDFFLGDFLGEDPDDAFFSAFFFSSELSGHLHPHPHTTPDGIINIWILYKTSQECLCHCLFIGQVMSPHHSDQMSQGSQVSWVALWRFSQNVFVIVIVFVVVIVIDFLLVRSCLLITLIRCVKGHKSLGKLSGSISNNGHLLTHLLTYSVTRSPVELSGDS